jgi:hypothetical protein
VSKLKLKKRATPVVPSIVETASYYLDPQAQYAADVLMLMKFNDQNIELSEVEIEHIKISREIKWTPYQCAEAIAYVRYQMELRPEFRSPPTSKLMLDF